MKITHEYEISGREVFVLDDCFDQTQIDAIAKKMWAGPHQRKQGDRMETRKNLSFSTHFDLQQMKENFIGKTTIKASKLCFPKQLISPYTFYLNLGLYGDSAYTHRDCSEWGTDITALIFANPKWDPEWGGETLFYDDAGEAVVGVTPKPGRIAIFRAAVVHRPGLVTRECYSPRLTIACKFRGKGGQPVGKPWLKPCPVHETKTCSCRPSPALRKKGEEQKAKRAKSSRGSGFGYELLDRQAGGMGGMGMGMM